MSRRRQLSDEERALWSGFTRSIMPLRPAKATKTPKTAKPAKPAAASKKAAAPSPHVEPRAQPPLPVQAPPLAALERRLKQRVARGRDAIDARIDLHGMTQSQA